MYALWFNGEYKTPESFAIPVNDLGLLRGYALFDYFRTYYRKPFQWDWYWERFENSARIMQMDCKIDKKTALEVVETLIEKSPGEVAVRILLTGGFSADSISASETNLFIIAEPLRTTPENKYESGLHIETREYMRDLPDVKTTDYKYLLLGKKQAASEDFLYHHRGFIYELSRSNLFLVKNGVLITPSQGILRGISRRLVLELAHTQGYALEERAVRVEELLKADEVFTTSSTKQVLGITTIGNKAVGNGRPGEITRHLKSLFQNFIDENYA